MELSHVNLHEESSIVEANMRLEERRLKESLERVIDRDGEKLTRDTRSNIHSRVKYMAMYHRYPFSCSVKDRHDQEICGADKGYVNVLLRRKRYW